MTSNFLNMPGILITAKVDTSVLEAALPQIIAFGKRTMVEQCVTSAGTIVLNAQSETVAVAVGTIEEELQIEVTPAVLKSGRLSRDKRKQREIISITKGARVPLGVLIVMARGNPFGKYSLSTGDRWPLALPFGGPGYRKRLGEFVAQKLSRMSKARFSSTHFLQHGWAMAIRFFLGNEHFKGWASKYQMGPRPAAARANVNPLNHLDPGQLGDATIEIGVDSVLVTAANAVGEAGNEVLDAKHRAALIEYGTVPLQMAVDREAELMIGKVEEYLARGLQQRWRGIL